MPLSWIPTTSWPWWTDRIRPGALQSKTPSDNSRRFFRIPSAVDRLSAVFHQPFRAAKKRLTSTAVNETFSMRTAQTKKREASMVNDPGLNHSPRKCNHHLKIIGRMLCLGLFLSMAACQSPPVPDTTAVLWTRTAAEYAAGGYQAYNAARMNLEAALADPGWTAALEQSGDYAHLPPAVIFDIDETVLDSSEFQGWRAMHGGAFNKAEWDRWGRLNRARRIAGAVDFLRHLQDQGIAVFFITNRACRRGADGAVACPQALEAIENLNALGISGITTEHLLLKDEVRQWGSDKTHRRAVVARGYRVLMLFGDDLNDFIPGVRSGIAPEERRKKAGMYKDWWGRKWYILPNPVYGSWRRVLAEPVRQYLEADF
jgi:acid phosphatase